MRQRLSTQQAGPGSPGSPTPAPRATYRLQLNAGFTFDDAAAQADYLAALGVSHAYLSPVLQAAPGSTHGYDVVDPTRVNRELGGQAGHDRLCATLGQAGLGQLLDVVPNHMAIGGRDNAWWWDVLTHGPASRYADYFDVDWDPPTRRLRDAVMLPILGDQYGRELEAGRITVTREGPDLVVRYFEHSAPVDPASIDTVLEGAAGRLEPGPPQRELRQLAVLACRLPPASQRDPASVDERATLSRKLDQLLARVLEQPGVAAAVDAELARLNADYDALDRFLDRQNYRLAWWRAAGQDLDYRRFFDINDLAAIRVEDPEVFAESHRLVLDWLRRRVVDGVRVDHVDGLYDPGDYLRRLAGGAGGPGSSWIVVEKILEGDEQLPATWPVAGTTGYDWLNRVGRLLTSRPGWERLVEGYREFTGVTDTFEEIAYQAKRMLLGGALGADLNRVVAAMAEVCAKHRRHRDYTRQDLRVALAEIAAGMRVYRSYVTPAPDSETAGGHPAAVEASPADIEVVNQAVLGAGMRRPDIDEDLLGFVRDVLVGRMPGVEEADVALRFQQLTGPVMAKAVEDTAFYRWVPLTSLNEVGGDPGRVDDDLEAFHAACAAAHDRHPLALLATSSHDTKRSEDVRARIATLAEVTDEWAALVARWWAAVPGAAAGVVPPDRNTAWLLLQTLVGAWPIGPQRVVEYLEKATREAKEHTSWTEPDAFYDEMLKAFATAAVDDVVSRGLVEEMVRLVRRPGRSTALAMKLLTLTAPGVPDVYQGSELWDLSLVDPDNRRPVDYALRRRLLASLEGRTAADVWEADEAAGEDADGDTDGAVKLAVVAAALAARRAHPAWWGPGSAGAYLPLEASGPAAAHLVAFGRGVAAGAGALTLATRWPLVLERSGGWRDTSLELPPGVWVDQLSSASWSGTVAVGDVLGRLPVALLVAGDADAGA